MRTITIEKTLYTYDELSEKAKERVRESFSRDDDGFIAKSVTEAMYSTLANDGWDVENKSVEWSIHSNCDFATFGYTLTEAQIQDIIDNVLTDKERRRYKRIKALGWYELSVKSTRNRYYSYVSNKAEVEEPYWNCDPIVDRFFDEVVGKIRSYVDNMHKDACRELLQMAEAEYEYQGSDECVRETCEANEYEFDENGVLQ